MPTSQTYSTSSSNKYFTIIGGAIVTFTLIGGLLASWSYQQTNGMSSAPVSVTALGYQSEMQYAASQAPAGQSFGAVTASCGGGALPSGATAGSSSIASCGAAAPSGAMTPPSQPTGASVTATATFSTPQPTGASAVGHIPPQPAPVVPAAPPVASDSAEESE